MPQATTYTISFASWSLPANQPSVTKNWTVWTNWSTTNCSLQINNCTRATTRTAESKVPNCLAAKSNALPSLALWSRTPRFSCLTKPPQPWMKVVRRLCNKPWTEPWRIGPVLSLLIGWAQSGTVSLYLCLTRARSSKLEPMIPFLMTHQVLSISLSQAWKCDYPNIKQVQS